MDLDRRQLIAGAAFAAAVAQPAMAEGVQAHYGLIGKLRATPGQRDRLIYFLLEGAANMPGCLSYIVATDPADSDAIWITEAWESEASHKASLSLLAVREAIAKARPIIAGFDESHATIPIGGVGLRG